MTRRTGQNYRPVSDNAGVCVDATDGEIVDEVAAEVVRLDQHGDSCVADDIDGADVPRVVGPGETWIGLHERREIGDGFVAGHLVADVPEHVGQRMKCLAHLVAVAVRTFHVQLDKRPYVGDVLQVSRSHGVSLGSIVTSEREFLTR